MTPPPQSLGFPGDLARRGRSKEEKEEEKLGRVSTDITATDSVEVSRWVTCLLLLLYSCPVREQEQTMASRGSKHTSQGPMISRMYNLARCVQASGSPTPPYISSS